MGLLMEPATGVKGASTPDGEGGSMRMDRRVILDPSLILLGVLGLCVAWSLWPNLVSMARKWSSDARYSHGVLVPVFAAVLWKLRMPEGTKRLPGANWLGLTLVAIGAFVQLTGSYVFIEWVETLSILFYVAALVALWGGPSILRWAWAPVAYLVFMIPLPYRVETGMGWPLQHAATVASTFLLQTVGLSAGMEGNTIVLPGGRIGVVEACNGLGILFTFLATASAVALAIDRSVWQKCLIVASAAPIALVANITRITATGYLHETVGGPVADMVYHDLAGWLMMPFALVMLWGELRLASLLVIDPEPESEADPV